MIFVQLDDLDVRDYVGVEASLFISLPVETLLMDRSVKRILAMEARPVLIQSRAAITISEYISCLYPPAVLQSISDAKTNNDDQQDNS